MPISDERYNRQIILSNWGRETQQKLTGSEVVVVGCGALGTYTVSYLARAGVGKISVVDRDYVELSNLHRTSLFLESDLGEPKATTVKKRISQINADVTVEAITRDLDPFNAERILRGHDLILDCTDNLLTRYLINDCSVKFGIPWIYAAVIETQGMTMNIIPEDGPCFCCLFPERPPAGTLPTCDTAGVINTIPPVISSIQATEAIKYLTEKDFEVGHLSTFDIWAGDLTGVDIEKDEDCRCCGKRVFEFLEAEVHQTTTSMCGRDAVQINPHMKGEMDLEKLAENLQDLETLEVSDVLLRFEVDNYKIILFKDGRAIVEGTEDEKLARSIYSRYIGN